jgi:hypothetical protein
MESTKFGLQDVLNIPGIMANHLLSMFNVPDIMMLSYTSWACQMNCNLIKAMQSPTWKYTSLSFMQQPCSHSELYICDHNKRAATCTVDNVYATREPFLHHMLQHDTLFGDTANGQLFMLRDELCSILGVIPPTITILGHVRYAAYRRIVRDILQNTAVITSSAYHLRYYLKCLRHGQSSSPFHLPGISICHVRLSVNEVRPYVRVGNDAWKGPGADDMITHGETTGVVLRGKELAMALNAMCLPLNDTSGDTAARMAACFDDDGDDVLVYVSTPGSKIDPVTLRVVCDVLVGGNYDALRECARCCDHRKDTGDVKKEGDSRRDQCRLPSRVKEE